jgi:hypothetical protein
VTSSQASTYVEALLKAVAERVAKLPFEAEPANFQAEQRRNAP